MKNIIKLLPESVSNQIAAGEVVQRPASAVKELMENAIDSNATEIQLIIKNAGKTLIQVIDNGIGMSEIDAKMCFERHATSKISDATDLLSIKTLGFRGEALASIAAVSSIELKTNVEDSDIGTKLIIEGSKFISQTPVATPQGTSIAIKNLYYNVPARRNFLKSDAIETKYIIDEFQHIALSNHDITFTMYKDDKQIYYLPKSKLCSRIIHIFGKSYQDQLLECNEKTQYININGFIGRPENSKKKRGEQFFFVNNRYIKSNYLNFIVKKAYEGLIDDKSHPFYVLFLTIDPSTIDINVHPSKAEIKFEDERLIYSVLESALKKTIGTYHVIPSIDFTSNINSSQLAMLNKVQENRRGLFSANHSNFKNYDKELNKDQNWQEFIQTLTPVNSQSSNHQTLLLSQSTEEQNKNGDKVFNMNLPTEFKKIQIHGKYILSQIKSGLIIIDLQAAQYRILYEKYQKDLKNKTGNSQQLLFPEVFEMRYEEMLILKELSEEIVSLGFKVNMISDKKIEVKGVPHDIIRYNSKEALENIISAYIEQKEIKTDKDDYISKSLAKRASTSIINTMTHDEINSLIDNLFACHNSSYTPDGKSIYIQLRLNEIENMFLKEI